jgi:7-cyano-7-deazaguanine synthase
MCLFLAGTGSSSGTFTILAGKSSLHKRASPGNEHMLDCLKPKVACKGEIMKTMVLFSGGIDSTVALAMLLQSGRECVAVSFDYRQRHRLELKSAAAIARHYKVPHVIISIDSLQTQPSTTAPANVLAPHSDHERSSGLNGMFIACAAVQAELSGADEIVIGVSLSDSIAYADCRPEYFEKIQALLNVSSVPALEGRPQRLSTPLIDMTKADIIRKGIALKAPLHLTFTCRDPLKDMYPCQLCLACKKRNEGYHAILYQGQKQQLRRSKPAERKDAPESSVDIYPLVEKGH